MRDWINVNDELPTDIGPFEVLCPAALDGSLEEDIRTVYFNVEQGRSYRVLETKGIFKCVRLVSHWKRT